MTDEKMPETIWTDINGNAAMNPYVGGTQYTRADIYSAELEKVRELVGGLTNPYIFLVAQQKRAISDEINAILDKITGDKTAEAELIERMHQK